jgi:hypothetical protein
MPHVAPRPPNEHCICSIIHRSSTLDGCECHLGELHASYLVTSATSCQVQRARCCAPLRESACCTKWWAYCPGSEGAAVCADCRCQQSQRRAATEQLPAPSLAGGGGTDRPIAARDGEVPRLRLRGLRVRRLVPGGGPPPSRSTNLPAHHIQHPPLDGTTPMAILPGHHLATHSCSIQPAALTACRQEGTHTQLEGSQTSM